MPPLKRVAPLSAQRKKSLALTEPELVDKRVVAADLHVGLRTIEKWVAERRIPFIRFGHRSLRFNLDSVRRAVARWETKEIS
jgi:excisionase family DNA binding protein